MCVVLCVYVAQRITTKCHYEIFYYNIMLS